MPSMPPSPRCSGRQPASRRAIGLLWSLSVAAEVLVFFLLGRGCWAAWGWAGCGAGGGGGGAALVGHGDHAALAFQFPMQPLHGLTFAALQLASMASWPGGATAAAASAWRAGRAGDGAGRRGADAGLGAAVWQLGAGGFWAMAALCACALPAAMTLAERGAPAKAPLVTLLPAAPVP